MIALFHNPSSGFAFPDFCGWTPSTANTQLGFKHTELPALQRMVVTSGGFCRNVELEARQIKSDGLADGSDVGILECEKNAETPHDDIIAFGWIQERDFKFCQLPRVFLSPLRSAYGKEAYLVRVRFNVCCY